MSEGTEGEADDEQEGGNLIAAVAVGLLFVGLISMGYVAFGQYHTVEYTETPEIRDITAEDGAFRDTLIIRFSDAVEVDRIYILDEDGLVDDNETVSPIAEGVEVQASGDSRRYSATAIGLDEDGKELFRTEIEVVQHHPWEDGFP